MIELQHLNTFKSRLAMQPDKVLNDVEHSGGWKNEIMIQSASSSSIHPWSHRICCTVNRPIGAEDL